MSQVFPCHLYEHCGMPNSSSNIFIIIIIKFHDVPFVGEVYFLNTELAIPTNPAGSVFKIVDPFK